MTTAPATIPHGTRPALRAFATRLDQCRDHGLPVDDLRAAFVLAYSARPASELVEAIQMLCDLGHGHWQSPGQASARPATHLYEIQFMGVSGWGTNPADAARSWRMAARNLLAADQPARATAEPIATAPRPTAAPDFRHAAPVSLPPLDVTRRLRIRAMVALINDCLEPGTTTARMAALGLLSDLQAAGDATITTLPDGTPCLRLYGISGAALGGPAPLLRDWQAEALTTLARQSRP